MLVRTATRLFGERGYSAVAAEDVVRAAGVTRGSLYHHFRDKADLFAAVLAQVESDLADAIDNRSGSSDDHFERLIAALDVFLDACQNPAFRRIALLDAPAVLGWRELRSLDDRFALGYVKRMLADAMDQQVIDRVPVEALAHLLLGASLEAGMLMGRSADVDGARRSVDTALRRVLEGLRAR